ncbi:MAG: YdeI/OmpD-associated family protein [Sphingomonadales bacterium]|jgi:uncharacterized protein YdeI (YjbR/CyaY-like superfamily)
MEADVFFSDGCGRCPLGGTSGCKVHQWREEVLMLREILLQSGLTETRKWGVPCYVHGKKNVVLLSVLKESATLSFLKGALLSDPAKLLHKPGENSQAARYMKFTSPDQVLAQSAEISAYVREAVKLEESGQKVVFKAPQDQAMCDELQEVLKSDVELNTAFYALTPGRQRGYILFFGGAKQAKTRMERIDKWRDKILQGKGMQD